MDEQDGKLADVTTRTNGGVKNDGARVRFRGVAPAANEKDRPDNFFPAGVPMDSAFEDDAPTSPVSRSQEALAPPMTALFRNKKPHHRNWEKIGAQLEWASLTTALFVAVTMFIGLPIGTAIAHLFAVKSLDGWSIAAGFTPWSVGFGFLVPLCLVTLGFAASRMSSMVTAAEQIAEAAHQISQPDQNAVHNIQSVGAVVRSQVDAINAGIDDALIRLASVEAMIRQHVDAIEQAGVAIETRTAGALDNIVNERTRLIKLTEQLNTQADDFAVAIAEKAQASIDSFSTTDNMADEAEQRLEKRLTSLQGSADRALTSFQALRQALSSADDNIGATAQSIEEKSSAAKEASDRAARIAEEAAETAARNAANVGQFAEHASTKAKEAADAAIEKAREETERMAQSAVNFVADESTRVSDAVAKAAENVRSATDSATRIATEDAEKAVKAAELVADAAKRTSDAAEEATARLMKSSEDVTQSAETALAKAEAAAAKADARNKELAAARSALETENARLEALITEQRDRADRLADAIAAQTERLSRLAEAQLREQEVHAKSMAARAATTSQTTSPQTPPHAATPTAAPASAPVSSSAATNASAPPSPQQRPTTVKNVSKPVQFPSAEKSADTPNTNGSGAQKSQQDDVSDRRHKSDVSWREILTATDDAASRNKNGGQKNGGGEQASAAELKAVKVIHRLQNFTVNLERRLYGDPPESLLDRFDRGDRNVFANRLLRLNEADIKRRIRTEIGRDKAFEKALHDFLQGFEGLLEDATTSETADEELEQYLSSPLGRVYLLIGATVGYFA